ncbi:MAG TPA: hypothetical protein VFZ91_00235 [Allosphingosinicella sp.]
MSAVSLTPHHIGLVLIAWLGTAPLCAVSAGPPASDVWITYSPGGAITRTGVPQSDDSVLVSVADLRPPIFSLRLRPGKNGLPEVGLLTPRGFDSHRLLAAEIEDDDWPRDAYWRAARREARLETALVHHRPAVRLRIGRQGKPQIRNAAEIRRHEACARRLLRAVIEEQLAAAENEEQRKSQQKRLRRDYLASVAAPVEHASLLLRLVMLSLPTSAYDQNLDRLAGQPGGRPDQWDWRLREIRTHGRPVRLQLDLQSAVGSPAASLCRSLAYRTISKPTNDTCTIQGVIDRRDGWPITIGISRKGKAADGATERDYRSFNRVTPLQGFMPPANPCSAKR